MRKIMLNGQWELAEAGNDRLCEVQVPGSVLSGLYGAGKIEDPFYRTNEDVTRELFRKDYEFSRTFVAAEDILKEEKNKYWSVRGWILLQIFISMAKSRICR